MEMNGRMNKRIFIFFCLFYLVFASGHIGGDSFWNFLTTESLILDGDLELNDHNNPARLFGIPEYQESYELAASTEYSKFGIGMPIVQIPFFIVGLAVSKIVPIHQDYCTMFFVSLTNIVVIALFMVLMYKIGLPIIMLVALGCGTYFFSYSSQGFIEPLVVLCMFASFYFPQKGHFILGGLLYSFAVLTRFDSVIYLPLWLWVLRDNKRYIPYYLIGIMLYLEFNYFRYDDMFNFGYAGQQVVRLNLSPVSVFSNLWGMFLSSGKSMFIYAPVTIFAMFNIKKLLRDRDLATVLLGILIVNVLLYSCYTRAINGGVAWGLRYSLICVPILTMITALHVKKRYLKIAILIGFLIQLPSVLVNSGQMSGRAREYVSFELMDYSPAYSHVVMGWYQIASAVTSTVSGKHLSYPTTRDSRPFRMDDVPPFYTERIPLEGIDNWDLWWINIWRVIR